MNKRVDKKLLLYYFGTKQHKSNQRFSLHCSGIKQRKAQIWIETVIYTLIALVMIGAVLAFINPKIQELQDKAVISQSIELMEYLNSRILSTIHTSGNKRVDEFTIKKGTLKIEGIDNKIVFEMESRYEYSEPETSENPGAYVQEGNIIGHTKKKGKFSLVTLTINYNETYDLTYQGKDEIKTISRASTPYKISILNKGIDVKLTEEICSENNDCTNNDIIDMGYFAICIIVDGGSNYCEYIADKTTIDIEVS